MPATQKPTILLVHGGWHLPVHYRPALDVLELAGYLVEAPPLPSCVDGKSSPEDDVALITRRATELVETGREVVAIAHSYGGMVASAALSGLGVRERQQKGLQGGVKRIIYTAAFVPLPGTSIEKMSPTDSVGWLRYEGDQKALNWDWETSIGDVFYPDLAKDEQQKYLALLAWHPKACSLYEPTKFAYREIDMAYVFCEKDAAAPLVAQKFLAGAIKNMGVEVAEETLPAGHFPFLSMPKEFAEIVMNYA